MNLQFRIKIYFIYTIPSVRFKVADGTKTGCNFQIESYPILASSQHIGATARLTTTAPYLTIVGIDAGTGVYPSKAVFRMFATLCGFSSF